MAPGDHVRLRSDSVLYQRHPELADAVGIVSSAMMREGALFLHVRFEGKKVAVLNIWAAHFEPVDQPPSEELDRFNSTRH